jgi:hypothetical protein
MIRFIYEQIMYVLEYIIKLMEMDQRREIF